MYELLFTYLHSLWPQNKRLRTLWTTDWMHTGQDRWIQTELAFTLAKNATKPNSFEIISLQTTRKKNNWKTEETLARTVVTLETERIKGSNPWCLWWWSHSRDPNIGRSLEVNVLRTAQDGFWCQLRGLSCCQGIRYREGRIVKFRIANIEYTKVDLKPCARVMLLPSVDQ